MSIKKAYEVARKFRIRVYESPFLSGEGMWRGKRTIIINPAKATAYTILHEIGHVICGMACCREHCEYMAHGAALALARVYKIRLKKANYEAMDEYAGYSPRKACGGIAYQRALKQLQRKARRRAKRRRSHTSYPK